MDKNKIFAVTYNDSLRDAKFFTTQAKARAFLEYIKSDRRHRFGVEVFTDEPNTFTFQVGGGWQGSPVTFYIKEINVDPTFPG